ncbi:MAG: cupin [Candidatus Marinimicrobia bacterium]|nr:cupin [Candidatus Neomarinimicrobiota bacterium]|tara:strand:- start:4609 stop:4878 length:270 start_codon:yes stop_codon:yes gene_type:complete
MKIKVIKNKKLEDFKDWPLWSCDVSVFDWSYEQEEHCYIISGKVLVKGPINSVNIGSGDYVVFPKGLNCTWKVEEPIKKHYKFIKKNAS